LPSLLLLQDNIIAGTEEGNTRLEGLSKAAGFAGKAFIVAFGGLQTFFDDVGETIRHFGASSFTSLRVSVRLVKRFGNRDWNALKQAVHDTNDNLNEMTAHPVPKAQRFGLTMRRA